MMFVIHLFLAYVDKIKARLIYPCHVPRRFSSGIRLKITLMMMMPFYKKTIFLLLAAFLWLQIAHKAGAASISFIRDTEIENTIRLYSKPIFEVAGLDYKAVQVFIINNDELNAFVTNGQKIFLNTGTLRHAELPEEVIGVIAHEVGHITGGHLAKLHESMDRAKKATIASLLVGVPLAVLSGQADIALAASSLGLTVAERDFLAYSRVQEQSADQAGVEFMNKAGIDPNGLTHFMERLDRKSRLYQGAAPDPYQQTHPLTQERLEFLVHEGAHSAVAGEKMPAIYYHLHERMRVKLTAFLEPAEVVLRQYPISDQSLYGYMARAIAHMRLAQFDQAIDAINILIDQHPDDPFLIELKGDIYQDAGELTKAAEAYAQAVELLPWAGLIRIQLAEALIRQNDETKHASALEQLEAARLYEPNSPTLWRNFGIIYERQGNMPLLTLTLAETAIRTNDAKRAKQQAERAIQQLPRQSPAWQRARDILNQANLALTNMGQR
ncbi:MAG: M48 family metalloprotease [Alphaproteobacteria bacterium]